LLLWLF